MNLRENPWKTDNNVAVMFAVDARDKLVPRPKKSDVAATDPNALLSVLVAQNLSDLNLALNEKCTNRRDFFELINPNATEDSHPKKVMLFESDEIARMAWFQQEDKGYLTVEEDSEEDNVPLSRRTRAKRLRPRGSSEAAAGMRSSTTVVSGENPKHPQRNLVRSSYL